MQQATGASAATTLVTVSAPLLMGGEHSAFRSLVPSSAAALLAASAQFNSLARSYATTSISSNPSPIPSDSEEEINVHDDESETDIPNNNGDSSDVGNTAGIGTSIGSLSTVPLQLTKHDRNWVWTNSGWVFMNVLSASDYIISYLSFVM